MEAKFNPIKDVKLESDGEMTFSGYGAVFGNVDAGGDVIAPGAFAKSLAESRESDNWPAMLLQHGGSFSGSAQDMTPIGVWTELSEDGYGLKVTGKLANTERGREAYELMKMSPRPAINGLSIGYSPTEFENRSKPEDPKRTLKSVKLYEVSLVTFPMNGEARIKDVKSITDIENTLRLAGLSRKEAKTLISKIKEFNVSESEEQELNNLLSRVVKSYGAKG